MTRPYSSELRIGSRVRVRRDSSFPGPWPAEPLGTVIPWPAELKSIDPTIVGGELFRIVDHRSGKLRAYFIEFDEPQLDTDGPDGGGPYTKASILELYLEPAEAD